MLSTPANLSDYVYVTRGENTYVLAYLLTYLQFNIHTFIQS